MTEGSPDNTAMWMQTIWRKPKEDLTSTESRGASWCQNICSKQKKGMEEKNKCLITLNYRNWNCLVTTAIRLRPRRQMNRGSIPGGGKRFVSLSNLVLTLGPTQPNIQSVMGDLSWGLRWPDSKADHSPLSNVKLNYSWNNYHHSSTCLHGAALN
jgi:hypothetical protein